MSHLAPWVPTFAEAIRDAHAGEGCLDWQYACVFRMVHLEKPCELFELPRFEPGRPGADWWRPEEREGLWEPNVDYRKGDHKGWRETRMPNGVRDGTMWLQCTYWRRPCPGMRRGNVRRQLCDMRDPLYLRRDGRRLTAEVDRQGVRPMGLPVRS